MITRTYPFESAFGHHFVATSPDAHSLTSCFDCGRPRNEHLIKVEEEEMKKGDWKDPIGNQEDIAKFKSGAVRSEKAPPWFMLPWDALRVILERFNIGAIVKKYGIHNWKKAIGTGDLDFIRQLFDHTVTHMLMFIENVGEWKVDPEGKHADETPMDHLAAMGWGVLALITYTLYDRKNVMKAFSQWPEAWHIGEGAVYREHGPTSEFKLVNNHWVAEGRPHPPINAFAKSADPCYVPPRSNYLDITPKWTIEVNHE